jgi:hypothetical protein
MNDEGPDRNGRGPSFPLGGPGYAIVTSWHR